MLRMDQVHVIRHNVLVEGQSMRSVARQMEVSRNTVRRYLRASAPVRVEHQPRARPVLDRVWSRIEALLDEWRPRTTAKQRVTGSRLHRQLVEEGLKVGVTTVRACLREVRRRAAEVFVPLVHRPGEAQVDFFEVTVDVGGERRKVWKFLLRLMYSGRDFVWLYDSCDHLAFLDGHVRAFSWLGWVPTRLVYDNLTAAVKHRVGLKRELTERFAALVSHYLFEPCFARPGEGHDKGSVEARGKAIRLQHLIRVRLRVPPAVPSVSQRPGTAGKNKWAPMRLNGWSLRSKPNALRLASCRGSAATALRCQPSKRCSVTSIVICRPARSM